MNQKTLPCLNIIEIFRSIQGETSLTGFPTTFIRLAACNLRCSWCDTAYSFGRGEKRTINELIGIAQENGTPYACITGGEPLLQNNVYPLMSSLCDLGFTVSLETGGSLPIGNVDPRVITILDIKCPGSGMSDKNFWNNLKILREHDEVKFVLKDKTDYKFAIENCHKYSLFERTPPVLFSPVFDSLSPKELVEWILEDQLPVRLNLQIHKYIWSPTTRGV